MPEVGGEHDDAYMSDVLVLITMRDDCTFTFTQSRDLYSYTFGTDIAPPTWTSSHR